MAKEQTAPLLVCGLWAPYSAAQTSNILAIADSGNMSDLEEQQRLMASYAPLEEGDRPEKISDVVLPDVPKMPGVKLPDDVRIGKYMDLAVTQASGVNPQCGACLNAAKPVLILPTRLIMCCVPYYQWAYHYAYLVFLALPTNVIQALFGIALCFFGGTYVASIAAIEAFRQMGFAKVMQDIAIVRAEYEAIAAANAAADAAGDAHDGIDPTQRKLMLSMNAISEPQRLQSAIGSLWASYIAVLATLKLEFARTTAFALGIVEIIKFPAVRLLSPLLLTAMLAAPPSVRLKEGGAKAWSISIVESTLTVLAVIFAWYLQMIISAFYSGLRGGRMFSDAFINILHENDLMRFLPCIAQPFNPDESVVDEVIGYSLAAFGFGFQILSGFKLPFPLNIIFFPLTIIEWFLRMQISMSASLPMH